MEKLWQIKQPDIELRDILCNELNLSKVAAQVLVNRGITSVEDAQVYLHGGELNDPFLMKDMKKAVKLIKKAIIESKKLVIFSDYDCDGVTSAVVLLNSLKSLGANVECYIPHRTKEGYGLNVTAIKNLHELGIQVIITADNGISSVEEVEYAKKLGIDVVVTDHHEVPEKLPKANAIINPKRPGCKYPFKDLAGVGVAMKLVQALGVPIETVLDLVCMGTIADVVPLVGENRELVKRGLPLMGTRPGISALMDVAGVSEKVTSQDIGFKIGPRINAAGRMAHAYEAMKVLVAETKEQADRLAGVLNDLNTARQKEEEVIVNEALAMIEAQGLVNDKVIVIAKEGWDHGIVGIVASRLMNKYYKPVFVLDILGDIAKGSARSIPGFHLFDSLTELAELIEKFGGHELAAGLTIKTDHINTFRAKLNELAEKVLTEKHLTPTVMIDASITLTEVTHSLLKQFALLEPFGTGNQEPVLMCRRLSVMDSRLLGNEGSHLKLKVSNGAVFLDSIGFRMKELAETAKTGSKIDVVFYLDKNEWKGKTNLQLRMVDLKTPIEASGELSFIEGLYDQAAELLEDDWYRDIGEREEFFTKVVGVSFEGRQNNIQKVNTGDLVRLIRDPRNKFDANAIKVERLDGLQLGFLKKEMAKHLAPVIDEGVRYEAIVTSITGGSHDKEHYGVNLAVARHYEETGEVQQAERDNTRNMLRFMDEPTLKDKIRQALLGHYDYRGKQQEVIDLLYQGINTLAVFGTGRGKSAVFQTVAAFKAIREGKMTVIVYPLRALVNDQYESMKAKFSELGLRVYKGNGSLSFGERSGLYNALEQGEVDILLTTPEFLYCHLDKIGKYSVGFFVVDEAHHIADAHRPGYKKLGNLLKGLNNPLAIAVTATADNDVADDIVSMLGIKQVVVDTYVRENLEIIDQRDCKDKDGYLKKIVGVGSKTIIYMNSREKAVSLATMLRETSEEMYNRVIFYHAGLTSKQRATVEEMFRNGEVDIVISTSAFGEGIDIPDIRHVILYHLGFSFTEFNQMSGRCGRDGQRAQIHLLCGNRDGRINDFILEAGCPDREFLAALFVLIRKKCATVNVPLQITNDEMAEELSQTLRKKVEGSAVSAGLGILEELGLIAREGFTMDRKIYLCLVPEGTKLDLTQSMRYTEGIQERMEFQVFRKFFFESKTEDLKNIINKPIFPTKYLEEKLDCVS